MAVLELTDISKHFGGVHALSDVSVWGSPWGSLETKRADFSVLKRKPRHNEKEPKALA